MSITDAILPMDVRVRIGLNVQRLRRGKEWSQEELATIVEVAGRFRISRAHLMKVAFFLGRGGFVQTVRGRAGGLRLARDARDISVGEVFRFMEGEVELVGCVGSPNGDCVVAKVCRLRGVFSEALMAFLAVLDRYTLADLAANSRLISLLRGKAA